MELTYDSRHDRRANLQTTGNASWMQIEEAIRRLDARSHTEVSLKGVGYLTVGGGTGRYFVSMFTRDERSFVLIDASKPGTDKIHLIAGGQKVHLPARQVVDIAAAIKAARAFFESEGTDETQSWIEE